MAFVVVVVGGDGDGGDGESRGGARCDVIDVSA